MTNSNMTFTCLVAAWNEAPRIGCVLEAISQVEAIERVIVVDDGSTDGTAKIARKLGADVIRIEQNGGKTAAIVQGLRQVQSGYIVFIDADLTGLTADDIRALIEPVCRGAVDVTMSLRGNSPWLWLAIGLDYLTGERVVPLDLIKPHFEQLEALPNFGLEVFLNRLALDAALKIAVLDWPSVKSPSKAEKRGLMDGVKGDVAMMWDIVKTIGIFECTTQIVGLRLSRRAGSTALRSAGRAPA
jgi:glycosyltransferase involved in cell wall biosynthesis